MSLPVADFAAKAKAVKEAQEAIDAAIEAKGVEGSGLSTAAERVSKIGVYEHRYAVPSPVKWTAEWEEKGKNGTILDIVVGDDKATLLKFCLRVRNLVYSDPVVVDWGDGTTSTAVKNTSDQNLKHDYAAPGHYVVTVPDTAYRVTVHNSGNTSVSAINQTTVDYVYGFNSAMALRRVRQFGSKLVSLAYFASGARYCNVLDGYSYDLPPIPPGVVDLSYAFYGFVYYNGHMPFLGHLTKCLTMSYTFAYWTSFSGDLQQLPPNLTTCYVTFAYMWNLKYIPYDVFPDSLSSSLVGPVYTNTASVATFIDDHRAEGEFPKISHLVSCRSFKEMFRYCRSLGTKTGLPELPYDGVGERFDSMFNECVSVQGDYPDLSRLTHALSINSMFYNCYSLDGPLPSFPPTDYRSIEGIFYQNTSATGTFPSIRMDFPNSLSNVFYCCRHVKGPLPAVPKGATTYTSMFAGCRSATGAVPDLTGVGVNVTGTSTTYTATFNGMFSGCEGLTDPPAGFLSPESSATSFSSMFNGCVRLRSFPIDLSAYTKVTSVANMFTNCWSLEHGPTALPPNVTSTYYLFCYCNRLEDPIISPVGLPKLVNIQNMYYYCGLVKPILASDGTLETDSSKIYSPTATTYGGAFSCTSPLVQKQIYNACISAGASGTKWGAAAAFKGWEE